MKEKRVVITGIGLITASGFREDTWADVRNGKSKAARFCLGGYEFAGARVKNGVCLKNILKYAMDEAVADSGIKGSLQDGRKIFSTISVSKPDFSSYLTTGNFSDIFNSSGVHSAISEAGIVCEQVNIAAACSTGIYSLISAYKIIRSGEADACFAGSGETPFNALYYSGFKNMGVLADDESPEKAMMPYDRRRKGFVLGEGACILALEEFDLAVLRGARIYAELIGGEMSFEPEGIFRFAKDSNCLAEALRRLCNKTRIKTIDGIYINSHGTATDSNDIMETNSFKKAFGRDVHDLKISSTKPVTGHLLGGSGALGAAFAALSLRDQYVPPTANLEESDPECSLDYIAGSGRSCRLGYSIAVSMGFGGHIGVLGLKRYKHTAG